MKLKLSYNAVIMSLATGMILIGCGGTNNSSSEILYGSVIKGPINNATIMVKDQTGHTLANTISKDGKFQIPISSMDADYYTIESHGGFYIDEATGKKIDLNQNEGLKNIITHDELKNMVENKTFVALTAETTIYADLVTNDMNVNQMDINKAMSHAKEVVTKYMINNSSPMTGMQEDTFTKVGDLTKSVPTNAKEAFAKNRAISFSYMMKDIGLPPQKTFETINEIADDLKDGKADGIEMNGKYINIEEDYALSRTKYFNNMTNMMQEGKLNEDQKEMFHKMGFDTDRYYNSFNKQEENLKTSISSYMNSSTLPTLHILPIMQDEDANPNDDKATYTLYAEKDVNVTIQTPDKSWITPMWRYNKNPLPMIIKADRGDLMTLNFTNKLDSESTIHWHGFKIPAIMDGDPDTAVAPNKSKVYTFTMNQPAAPLWFHPHPDMQTGKQVYMGLAGVFLLEDDISKKLEEQNKLPSKEKDIVLLIQDRRFANENNGVKKLLYKNLPMDSDGMVGSDILVNGSILPKHEVSTTQYRYRIYNVSNARTYDFALSDGSKFKVVGTDGGLLKNPIEVDHIMLGAAERAEIVIDFSKYAPGDKVMLISKPFNNGMMGMMNGGNQKMGMRGMMGGMHNNNPSNTGNMHGENDNHNNDQSNMMDNNSDTNSNMDMMNDGDNSNQSSHMGNMGMDEGINQSSRDISAFAIMRFDITKQEDDTVTLYTQLPPEAEINNRYTLSDVTNPTERKFIISMAGMGNMGANQMMMNFVINGKKFDPKRVDEFIENKATEVWSIQNMSPMAHPFHAHATQYQILDRNGVPANGIDLGWKDTFLVQPGETVRIIAKFEDVNKGDYMYHCHILEHEDAGMMGYFRVGNTGQLGDQ